MKFLEKLKSDRQTVEKTTWFMMAFAAIWFLALGQHIMMNVKFTRPEHMLYISALAFPAWVANIFYNKMKEMRLAAGLQPVLIHQPSEGLRHKQLVH